METLLDSRQPCFKISSPRPSWTGLRESFYDDDEDEEDDEEDDDDEYEDFDVSVEDFRSKMSSMFGESTSSDDDDNEMASDLEDDAGVDELIQFARSRAAEEDDSEDSNNNGDWAKKVNRIKPGTVLCANPQFFLTDFSSTNPDPSLLAKFGLTLPPPADLGADRRADLLPVLMVVEYDESDSNDSSGSGGSGKGLGDNNPFSFLGGGSSNNSKKGTTAILLNRRTGYLLGDLEPGNGGMGGSGDDDNAASATPTPLLEKFCIQPLWFGGIDNLSPGLEMLHQCPAVEGSIPLTEDGLYWGGEPTQAQEAMDASPDQQFTGFDFKFFVQATQFGPGQLEQQIEKGIWHTALVSKKVLFKSRDRMGTQRAKPLWTEIMELLGEDCEKLKNKLYNE